MGIAIFRSLASLVPPNFLFPSTNQGDIVDQTLALGPVLGPAKLAEILQERRTNIQGIWKLRTLVEELKDNFPESTQDTMYDTFSEFYRIYDAPRYAPRDGLIYVLKLVAAEGITEMNYFRALQNVSASASIGIEDFGPLGAAVKLITSACIAMLDAEPEPLAPQYVRSLRHMVRSMGFRTGAREVDRLRRDIEKFFAWENIAVLEKNEALKGHGGAELTRNELIKIWENGLRSGDNSILHWVGLKGNYANGPVNYRQHLDNLSGPWHQYLFERGILNGSNVTDERVFWGTGIFFAPMSADNKDVLAFGRFFNEGNDPLAILKSHSRNGRFNVRNITTYSNPTGAPLLFSAVLEPAKKL